MGIISTRITMNYAEEKHLKKLKEYCADTNQCYACFLTETESTFCDGLCSVCDDGIISDIKWVKSLTTPEIEEQLNAIKEITKESEHWVTLFVKELTLRKTDNCQGCKDGLLNQQGHMNEGGCLYGESE